ncbi:peroxiredoxin family protein [Deferrisoma palaeochoriense]
MRPFGPISRPLVLALSLLAVLRAAPALAGMGTEKLLQPGDAVPRFRFAEIPKGEVRSLAELSAGRPVLVVFLQTACRSCLREMLAVKKLHAESNGAFAVLGVFVDMKARDFEGYIRDYDLPFPFTWDPEFTLANAFGVTFTPASFLLSPDGTVEAVYRGFTVGLEEAMARDIDRVLRKLGHR